MIIEPKVRGFICTTAHPLGCKYQVEQQINYAKKHLLPHHPKKALIIGASTGYGLASRIACAFGARTQTIGVFYERPAEGKRTASPGWYNSAAFEQVAHKDKLYAKSINGDAFSTAIKQQVISLIQQDWGGEVDLVIYSLASPRRQDPTTGAVYQSALKPISQSFTSKTVNVMTGEVHSITLEPATTNEIEQTQKVMGGEDWALWIDALLKAKILAKKAMTIAYSYIGPMITYPVYRNGTIGKAKEDLEKTADHLNQLLQTTCQGSAYVSVNKALVTQASAAIPVVPLYVSLLYKIMKQKHLHEGCIEQMTRLFKERLYLNQAVPTDSKRLIRLDDWEMRDDVQNEITQLWQQVDSANIMQLSDLVGYRKDFYQSFGFECEGINYSNDIDVEVAIPSLDEPVQA